MRIIFIVHKFPVISETFIIDQVCGLIKAGHDVRILSLSRNGDADVVHAKVKEFSLMEKVFYAEIPKNKLSRAICFLAIWIKNLRFSFLFIKGLEKRGLGFINDIFLLAPFLKEGFDTVICHFGDCANNVKFIKDVFPGAKLVVFFHGYDVAKVAPGERERVYGELFQKADLLCPISEYWKKALESSGANPQKILVSHMGVDPDKFKDCGLLREGKELTILTVGRFVEKKGIEFSIRAFARVAEKYPNCIYKIVGDGVLNDKLRQIVETEGVVDKVKFLGGRTQEEVFSLLKESDIFMLTSITASDGDQEGIPVALMEAMAVGLPVISTYHSGIPELVENGVSGFLLKEKDVNAIAESLEKFIDSPQMRRGFGQKGRVKVGNEFNQEILNKELSCVIEKL